MISRSFARRPFSTKGLSLSLFLSLSLTPPNIRYPSPLRQYMHICGYGKALRVSVVLHVRVCENLVSGTGLG